jgi:DNA-binding IclR family transcriptional regulator
MTDKSDKSDTSLVRMLSVLDLFSDQRLHWSAEDISETLGVSLPTSYRYLKTLSDAGLLRRGSDAQFTLGPRIVVLDHFIRQADPVLQCGIPFMKELVAQTGFDCVVSSMHGDQLLDTHRELGSMPASLSYGRGRPRPLFQGAAPKVILAGLPTPQLAQIAGHPQHGGGCSRAAHRLAQLSALLQPDPQGRPLFLQRRTRNHFGRNRRALTADRRHRDRRTLSGNHACNAWR